MEKSVEKSFTLRLEHAKNANRSVEESSRGKQPFLLSLGTIKVAAPRINPPCDSCSRRRLTVPVSTQGVLSHGLAGNLRLLEVTRTKTSYNSCDACAHR